MKYGKNNKSLAKAIYIEDMDLDNFISFDIRNEDEIEEARINNDKIIYTQDASEIFKISQENKDKKILIFCKRGIRASKMGDEVVSKGANNIYFFDDLFSKFYEKFDIVGTNKDSLRDISY